MPTIRTKVDIDVYEVLDDCYDSDFDEIIEYINDRHPKKLKEFSGEFSGFRGVFNEESGLIYETQKKLFELGEHAHKFTNEEEEFLDKMYKRYL